MTCVYWNQAAAAIPAWPQRPLMIPSYLQTYSLPWDAFPTSFKGDADAYIKRLSGSDLLDDIDFRPLRPSSLNTKAYQLRQFASALVLRGRDPASLNSLADLVTPDAFKDGIRFFLDRHANKPTKQIHDVAYTLKAVAQHWVRVIEEVRLMPVEGKLELELAGALAGILALTSKHSGHKFQPVTALSRR